MASASSRRTLDTDNITLRKIFARLPTNNSDPPATYVLASGGNGTTYWAQPSTLGEFPSFQEYRTDVGTFFPSTSTTIQVFQGTNVYMSSIGLANLLLTSPLFDQIDISGSGTLYAFSNYQVQDTFKIASEGFVSSATTPINNTLFLSSTRSAPPISTNLISFQQLKIQSTVTIPVDLTQMTGNSLFVKNDLLMMPSLIGQRDLLLRPTVQPLQIQVELSSYSAKGYLALSTLVNTNFVSTLSTMSSIYVDKTSFSTAYNGLSTSEGFLASTSRSSILGVSNYTQVTYDNKVGDTLARATIIQVNDAFGLMNVGLSTVSSAKTPVYIMISTNQGVENYFSTPTTTSLSTFENFFTGSLFNFTVNTIFGVSTYFSTLSTQMNVNYEGFSNANISTAIGFIEFMKSTTGGLGTLNFISSPSLTSSLQFANTFGQYISTFSQTSTIIGLATVNYISQSQYLSAFSINYTIHPTFETYQANLTSTTKGTQDYAPYLSTLSFRSSLVSTTVGFPVFALQNYVDRNFFDLSLRSTTQGIPDYSAFNFGYISTLSFVSTLQSTAKHLGLAGYLSSATVASSLQSTIDNLVFWTGDQLASTISGPNSYIRTSNLESTSRYFLDWRGVFKSSLRYQGTPLYTNFSTLVSTGANYYIWGYFSTMSFFSLKDFFPYIRETSQVVLEYSPCVVLTNIKLDTQLGDIDFYTELRYNNNKTTVANSVYREQYYPLMADIQDLSAVACNYYRRTFSFSFRGSEILTLGTAELSVIHYMEIGSWCNTFENPTSDFYFRDQNFTNVTAPQNSFFVSIYN